MNEQMANGMLYWLTKSQGVELESPEVWNMQLNTMEAGWLSVRAQKVITKLKLSQGLLWSSQLTWVAITDCHNCGQMTLYEIWGWRHSQLCGTDTPKGRANRQAFYREIGRREFDRWRNPEC